MNQTFAKMTKRERKEFLSNDLVERLIRIEQRVSAKFGRLVPYNNTECYKSLTPENKNKFEKYMKNKKVKKVAIAALLVIPAMFFLLLNVSLTGNVVKENIGDNPFLDWFLIVFILISVGSYTINFIYKKVRNKRFEKHFKIIDNIHFRKGF
jgi:cation transport ATPase